MGKLVCFLETIPSVSLKRATSPYYGEANTQDAKFLINHTST